MPGSSQQGRCEGKLTPALGACGLAALAAAAARRSKTARMAEERESEDGLCPDEICLSRREIVQGMTAVVAVTVGSTTVEPAMADDITDGWVQYDLNTGETLYDVDFDPTDDQHGFVVGARGLFYETKDGGKRWVSRKFEKLNTRGDVPYRFQKVSCYGNDVWIVCKPPLLLHSKDSGATWKKVPVSRKLPGQPKVITALGESTAEMATSSGAIYLTKNNGKTWTSQVKETVDATLQKISKDGGTAGGSYFTGSVKSIKRGLGGQYLAVAQRGNFFLTFKPGDARWIPHPRISARRIQAMGFRKAKSTEEGNEGVWMSLNGGNVSQAESEKYLDLTIDSKELFEQCSIKSGGIGIIDIQFRTPTESWAVGGSGVIYKSVDSGKTWQYDPSGTSLPCNLYDVKFFQGGKIGYLVGSAGILLRQRFEA